MTDGRTGLPGPHPGRPTWVVSKVQVSAPLDVLAGQRPCVRQRPLAGDWSTSILVADV